ncbi:MAG TPA: methyl-accepting chemotaxis protein, partial [Vicinamibacteria bacterium]
MALLGGLRSLSIRLKLLGAFGPLVVAVVLFQVLYFPARQTAQASEDLRTRARTTAHLVAHDVGAAYEFGDVAAVQEVFRGAKEDPDLQYLVLHRDNGTRFAAYNPELAPAQSALAKVTEVSELLTDDRLTVAVPVATAGGTRGVLEAGFSTARIAAHRRRSQTAAVVSGSVILVIGLGLTILMSSYVGRRLGNLGRITERVAEGHLALEQAELGDRDEIGSLARSLERMVQKLRSIVENIREASVVVASSAGQISANARLITQGAQSQATAAEETSTSMEEMAASIDTVAGNAQSLASYVDRTSSSISEMGASIEQVAASSGSLASTVA